MDNLQQNFNYSISLKLKNCYTAIPKNKTKNYSKSEVNGETYVS